MAKSKMRDFFVWTDDEVELLLKVTHEYKTINAAENMDWESSKTKYGDIFERYKELYPSPEEAMATGKEYPHKKDEITKGTLSTKLKAIRFKYRQAVDSGRKTCHGRVIMLYFELCESIWGGTKESPDTKALSEGIDTGDVVLEANRQQREKLKRKLSKDSVKHDDLDIKKRLLHQLEATDDKFVKAMGRWSSKMDRLNSNIELLVQHIVGSGTNCTSSKRSKEFCGLRQDSVLENERQETQDSGHSMDINPALKEEPTDDQAICKLNEEPSNQQDLKIDPDHHLNVKKEEAEECPLQT